MLGAEDYDGHDSVILTFSAHNVVRGSEASLSVALSSLGVVFLWKNITHSYCPFKSSGPNDFIAIVCEVVTDSSAG